MAKPVVPLCSSKRFALRPRSPVSHHFISPRHIFHSNALLNAPSHVTGTPGQSHPTDPGAIRQHLVELASRLRPLLSASCGTSWLEQGSIEVIGEHPIDAGGVADILAGKMGNRKVAIKVYRCNSSSNCSMTFTVSATYSYAVYSIDMKFL